VKPFVHSSWVISLAVGPKPGEVPDSSLDAAALEEAPPMEDRVGEAEAEQPPRELELRLWPTRDSAQLTHEMSLSWQ
jgi:hypothetical protein